MLTKKDIPRLLNCVNMRVKDGLTYEQAVETLTLEEYDFLIDNDINFDEQLLTKEQLQAAQKVKRAPRPTFENGYTKKYTQTRIEFFEKLIEFLQENAANVTLKEKNNYRDVQFTVNGEKFAIVLSQPRK